MSSSGWKWYRLPKIWTLLQQKARSQVYDCPPDVVRSRFKVLFSSFNKRLLRLLEVLCIAFLIPVAGIRVQFTGTAILHNAFTKKLFQFTSSSFQLNARDIHLPVRSLFQRLFVNFHNQSNHFSTYCFQLTFHFSFDESCIQLTGTHFQDNEKRACHPDGVSESSERHSWSHFMSSIYNCGIYTVERAV